MPGPLRGTGRVPGKTPPDASGAGLTPDPQEPSDVPAAARPASPGRARCHPAATARIPAREGGPSSRSARLFAKPAFPRNLPFCAVQRASRSLAILASPASAKRPLAAIPASGADAPSRVRPAAPAISVLGERRPVGPEAPASVQRRPIPSGASPCRSQRLAAPGGHGLRDPCESLAPGSGCSICLRGTCVPRAPTVSPPLSAGGRKTREGLRGVSPVFSGTLTDRLNDRQDAGVGQATRRIGHPESCAWKGEIRTMRAQGFHRLIHIRASPRREAVDIVQSAF